MLTYLFLLFSIEGGSCKLFLQCGELVACIFESIDDLASKMTVPTDEAVSKVDLNELFVKIELRAVLKIRLLFTQWAQ